VATLEHLPYSWPDSSRFLTVASTENSIEWTVLLWCYHEEYDERAEKALKKWLSGMFPTPLQSLAEVYSFTRGLFLRECSWNNCTGLYFSEIKWFWKHQATTYRIPKKSSSEECASSLSLSDIMSTQYQ
jgi:hypothetical protein